MFNTGVQQHVWNSIVWDFVGGGVIVGDYDVSYCCVRDGAAGIGNISADPQFVNAAGSDFRLRPHSPAIDAGSNALRSSDATTDFMAMARLRDDPNSTDSGEGTAPVVDLGALEYPHTLCAGDVNGDLGVDLTDLAILLAHFDQRYASRTEGDLDGDRTVGLADLAWLLSHFDQTCY